MKLHYAAIIFCLLSASLTWAASESERPNILFAISDDQSFPHASAYGCSGISTPAFDRVAREGLLFTQAFVASPGCSPSRAAILTGRYPWQNEHAGTHASSFSAKFATYPKLLAAGGYHVGYTGKGWGPGNFQAGGFDNNPAGPRYSARYPDDQEIPSGISRNNYSQAFAQFLDQRPSDHPFCFWYGASEPHRSFAKGIGVRRGRQLDQAFVPPFLPDHPTVRADVLDYCFEIEWFDRHLNEMLRMLEEAGELDNTIVVVTSDNGMAFPRAKANLYDYGFHVPLAIRWPEGIESTGTRTAIVNMVDLMPTFLELSGVEHPGEFPMSGRSLTPLLAAQPDTSAWDATYAGRERHSSSRWNNRGYPQRCIRTDEYLYIRNYHPDWWPAGAPQKMGTGNYPSDTSQLGPLHAAYHDIDACPTLTLLVENADRPPLSYYLHLATAKRPAEELYNVRSDPGCLNNLAEEPLLAKIKAGLAKRLQRFLVETGDPRETGDGEIFESYRRYSRIRTFPQP